MRAFITGITGFAGGFLAEHLLASGDDVLGSSRRAEWPNWANGDLRRVKLLKWDVGDGNPPAEVATAVARFAPDCVYHLAALSIPSDCGTTDPTERAIQVNVRGTERTLDVAANLPRPPRVLFVSSSHVYAKATKEKHRFDESAPTDPQRAYGKTKLMAEEAVRRTAARRGVDTIIVRAFQHTGPRQEPRLMLPEWAAQFARPSSEPIQVKHLNTWVDLTDVRDVVRAYRLLGERGQAGGIYNLGSGVATRTGEILDVLLKLGRSSRAVVELQAGPEKYDPIADIRRLQAATGWRPELSLETTVADTLAYWRNTP
ncbi:MAG TPA: NAD-dependent epimerase/dehydratase family protein [Pirellulales bacterium]|nr:NAD-dependent epimerase/dehydratase family protein [Pirellulales bacterium]